MAEAEASNLLMSKARTMATRAAALAGDGVQFDPTSIFAIIMALFKTLTDCQMTPAEVTEDMREPGAGTLLAVREECRKIAPNRRAFKALCAVVLDQWKRTTKAELQAMSDARP